jgi:ferredoxin
LPELDIDQVADIVDQLEHRPVLVAAEHCTRQRHRHSGCTRCMDACPAGAIAWNEGLEIDWEACTGCRICATVCPTAALEAGEPSDDEVLVQIQRTVEKGGRVTFACLNVRRGVQGGGSCVPVNCLGRLNEALLVGAGACGAESVWLVDGECESCPQAVGRTTAGRVLTRSNVILEALGIPVRAAFRPDLPEAAGVHGGGNGYGQGVSRRGLFKALARETARVGDVTAGVVQSRQEAMEPGTSVRGELPKALPSNRLLLLATLKRLEAPAPGAMISEEGGPFASFQLAEGCTACQMCAFFCPTGALTGVVDGGKVGLAFRASHCTNCGLCRDICYRDAVRLSPQVDLHKLAALEVEWCFAQEMDAEPWKKGISETVARQILGTLRR